MLNSIIPEIDIVRNCWIVRSDGGRFYEHFLENSMVAIGHIDILNLNDISEYNKEVAYKTLTERFMASGKSRVQARRSAGNYIGQANRFFLMKENDYIITMGRSEIAIGQVVGEAFIGTKDLTVKHSSNNDLNMNPTLRRGVDWQFEVPREELSNMLLKTLSTPQTVILLEEFKKIAIFHTIFPLFLYNERIYLSVNIAKHKAIKNFHMSEMFSLLNEMEYIAREHDSIDENISFEKQYQNFTESNDLKLEVKASFMSPGEIWANILLNHNDYIHITYFYYLFLGGKMSEIEHLLDKETGAKIIELINDRLKKRKLKKITEDLKLKKPNHGI